MSRLFSVAAGLALAFCFHSQALAVDLANGKEMFEMCGGCHGEGGEGIEDMGPRLNGQQPWYLRIQIDKFRAGFRGYNEDDDMYGVMMRDAAQGIEDEKSILDVIAYIGTLKMLPGEATLEGGSAAAGKEVWEANCTFCHGNDGQGKKFVAAPRLAGQSDWYLVKQLNSFRSGLRGTHEKDERGKQMQSMSLILPDDKAVLDVATHISQMR